jgi:hypothetical protein
MEIYEFNAFRKDRTKSILTPIRKSNSNFYRLFHDLENLFGLWVGGGATALLIASGRHKYGVGKTTP